MRRVPKDGRPVNRRDLATTVRTKEWAMSQQAQTVMENVGQQTGKHLIFSLGGQDYGLGILQVREIIGMMGITSVPRTPEFIQGVINLRGKVVPVMDLRSKFGMPAQELTDETCIVVACLGEVEMGLIVDRVSEVLDISDEQIEETPSFGAGVNTEFILGVGKTDEKVIVLLDLSKILSDGEMKSLSDGDHQQA